MPYSSGPEPETRKVGGSARSLPPCCRAVSSGESGSSPTPISRRAGLAQGRGNLLVASDEVATVVNVRWGCVRQLLGGRIGAGHLRAEGLALARIGGVRPHTA